ncbi:MAG: rRNA maturation RNase YbeY [Candidatus Aureabacteria bacterium]|nr:rRNA maturation RNase YbeY [Candidatus Auribacterota bacterium]
MKIEIINLQKKKVNAPVARKIIKYVLDTESCGKAAELSVSFVDNRTIQRYNKKYMSKDRPTDVLSFPMGEGEKVEGDGDYMGDVMVSVEMAVSRAREFSNDIGKELMIYLIHGILHLLGYNDTEPCSRKQMDEKQAKISGLLWDRRKWKLLTKS